MDYKFLFEPNVIYFIPCHMNFDYPAYYAQLQTLLIRLSTPSKTQL